MAGEFGELLRRRRQAANRSLKEVADLLGCSVVYMSDVERGRRNPLRADAVIQVSTFLGTPATPLLQAAASQRGIFELEALRVTPRAQEVGARLSRGWERLSDTQLNEIDEIVARGSEK
jgi:transcriptional regulator with XRE-family HTH domain